MTNLKELRAHQDLQNLAFTVVKEVEAQLRPGHSEVDAVKMLDQSFLDKGITRFFHRPFAWFDQRSAFRGFSRPLTLSHGVPQLGLDFFPSAKSVLTEESVVILDVAPATKNASVDIGYSFAMNQTDEYKRAKRVLDELFVQIPKWFEQNLAASSIYRFVDNYLHENDYENIHTLYPKGVLGHRIGKLPLIELPTPSLARFSPQTLLYFIKPAPFLSAENHGKPHNGMWAVEPHLRSKNFGAKFEEILVFEDGRAQWLSQMPL